ncbi:RNA polymerase sigma factor (sigma-70 family) [Paenibacillus harenae]|uniref:RNA polymerase sigma factor n=1 Tax=Paenibacillus harenae TaxID=306543 RepID=A0ABT9U1J2_PAEHA|nr:RNA polymerase sigma factor (sigma-70 family) [Paenibacillus harenae]
MMNKSTEELVEQARGGGETAFAELVRRHRSKAFLWASAMAGDKHLAEDIVQEALLNAYLKLDSLADPARFVSWLHTIVKNQARMKMRQSSTRREQLGDGALIDIVAASNSIVDEDDSSHKAMDKVRELLGCLTVTERNVFAAHYLEQISPAEIAKRIDTTIDSVYHTLSRARIKIQEENKRHSLSDYIRERMAVMGERPVMAEATPPWRSSPWKQCKNSLASACYAVLSQKLKETHTISDVMGLTGQAFRLTVEDVRIDVSGPWMYFWEPIVQEGLAQLGMACRITGDGGAAPSPYMLHKSLEHIRSVIAAGSAVIAWGLFTAGFGVIYGYDDEQRLLYAEDARKKGAIPYESLGRGASDGLFIVSITEELKQIKADYRTSTKKALQMAIRHAYRERTFVGYTSGIAGYGRWRDAFAQGCADALGNAYCLQLTADARRHGAIFLQRLSSRFTVIDPRVADLAEEASVCMSETACLLQQLGELFPFPHGGNPLDASYAVQAVGLLDAAKRREEQAYERFGRIIAYLS